MLLSTDERCSMPMALPRSSPHAWVAYDGVEHERIAQGQTLLFVDLAQPDQKANGRTGRFDHRFIFQSLTRDLCHGLVIAENHGCNNEGADEEYQASFPAVAFACALDIPAAKFASIPVVTMKIPHMKAKALNRSRIVTAWLIWASFFLAVRLGFLTVCVSSRLISARISSQFFS